MAKKTTVTSNKKFNFKSVTPSTWVRIITLTLVLINQLAVTFTNVQLIPFEDEQIYESLSMVATFIVSIITAWKNNSFTVEAQTADVVLKSGRGVK